MKLYLAGPMTGLPLLNFPSFWRAAIDLRSRGHEVVSPAEMAIINGDVIARGPDGKELTSNPSSYDFPFDEASIEMHPKFSIYRARRADMAALAECEAIVLLPGWHRSDGALRELRWADDIGLIVWEYDARSKTGLVKRR